MGNPWKILFFLVPVGILFLASGCLYRVKLESSYPLQIAPQETKPIALLPISDVPGHPGSGLSLQSGIPERLAAKGYNLLNSEEVSRLLEELGLSTEKVLSNPIFLAKIRDLLEAKLFMAGTILDYRTQKSYFGTGTFQVWDGASYNYGVLPTYFMGIFQIRLRLKLINPEDGSVVWMAEGIARGPSDSAKTLAKRLVWRLLDNLPIVIKAP